jgi:diphosphomevalonate decarboxylase
MTGRAADGELAACAQAQPNIALVKYWGKRDAALNLPMVGSLSITLEKPWTRTRVRFDAALTEDRFLLNGRSEAAQLARVTHCLDLLRARVGLSLRAEVDSENSFPTSAGLASSASGFAALVVAADMALGLKLSDADKTMYARRCSGSAARSIFGGYVEWARGQRADGLDSVARPLMPASAWPLRVVVAITSRRAKDVGSTEGMNRTAATSPYLRAWIETQESDLAAARAAISARDFERLAEVSERSCLKMHALTLAAQPGLLYWNGATVECLHRVRALRAQGVPVFFTVDAGPHVKAVCVPSATTEVRAALGQVSGVLDLIETGLGDGARVIEAGDKDPGTGRGGGATGHANAAAISPQTPVPRSRERSEPTSEPTIVASAPGKLVLLGEYAVLEGAPALAIATSRRALVELYPLLGRRCEVIAPEIDIASVELYLDEQGLPDWRGNGEAAQKLCRLDQTIRGLAHEGVRLPPDRAFRLRLDTSAFFDEVAGRRLKLGLGSSAALTVALATALAVHAGRGAISADREVWLQRLLELHRSVQGGHGSGVDVAASLAGGVILYQLLDGGAHPEARAVRWPAGLHTLYVWTGRSASTPAFLARLSAWRAGHAVEYQRRMDELTEIAYAAAEGVRANQAATVLGAAEKYCAALEELGRASDVDIVSAEHACIAQLAYGYGALYKPCGAGGGDMGVAFALEPERLQRLRVALADNGFACPPIAVDQTGLTLQQHEIETVLR